MRDDHAMQLGIRSYSVSQTRLTVREMLKITDQLPHLRTRHVADRLNQIVIHARPGMLIKAPWEQYMVHMRAYPFKGLQFHGHNPQSWLLYVLNTFALGVDALDPLNPAHHKHIVDALDPLNPAHHKHIGVGLSILFFEVMYENFIVHVMNFMTQIVIS